MVITPSRKGNQEQPLPRLGSGVFGFQLVDFFV